MQAWHHLYPALPAFHGREQLRAGIGALLGISLCALLVSLAASLGLSSIYLIAPLGATAVLVFCVPNSPLAQPWSAVVGNATSALVALLVLQVVPGPWSAGIAVGTAIIVMMFVRALHPPGGAVALLTALDPAPALEVGPLFALVPVGVTTAVLVLAAIAYNRATGRVYPFRQPETDDIGDPALRLGLSTEQLGQLLDRFNQATNLGVADLGRLLAAAEAEAAQQSAFSPDFFNTIRPLLRWHALSRRLRSMRSQLQEGPQSRSTRSADTPGSFCHSAIGTISCKTGDAHASLHAISRRDAPRPAHLVDAFAQRGAPLPCPVRH